MKNRVILFVLLLAMVASGCGGFLVRRGGYSNCYEDYVNDGYGGYYQTYCYDRAYGGYVPATRGGYYQVRYPYGYRGSRRGVVVVPGAPVVYPGRGGGVIVTPPPRRGGGVIVTPPPRRGGGVIVTPPRGRPRPRKASVELPADAIRHFEFTGASFATTDTLRQTDPTMPADRVIVEATVIGESDVAVETFLDNVEKLRSTNVDLANAKVTIQGTNCSITETSEGTMAVTGVCVDDVHIVSRDERADTVNVNGARR